MSEILYYSLVTSRHAVENPAILRTMTLQMIAGLRSEAEKRGLSLVTESVEPMVTPTQYDGFRLVITADTKENE